MGNRLVITHPDGDRITYELAGDLVSLGRAADNDLSYPEDSGLSRRHLVIEKLDGQWGIRDLGSKNGTIVNEERITGRLNLSPGDQIRVSRLNLVFDSAEEDLLRGTVIFDPPKPQIGDHPATHTVTLGQLVQLEGQDHAGIGLSTQWSDPITALLRAGRELVARKPLEELFRSILDLSLESVGASRGVLLVQESGGLSVKASCGGEFRISTAVRDRVMKERTSLLVGDTMSDELLRGRESIVMQRVHSLMVAPLQTDERVLGLIYVDTPHDWHQFNPADLNLLTVMANVAAMGIERERLAAAEQERRFMERELQQAAEIQNQLLPGTPPPIRGLDLAGYNNPCYSVGGDYYDFLTMPDGTIMLALGDVAGKGMAAALLMVNLQARVQLLSERPGTPAGMVTSLNRALHSVCPSNRFITFFLCQIDVETGEVAFCNAGHNPPFLVRSAGDVETLEGGGPVLGIMPELKFQPRRNALWPGDLLVAYSDGVTEANNPEGEEFGEQRLEQFLVQNRNLGASQLIKALNDELEQFIGGAPQTDDITIVVARRTGN